MRTKLQSTRFLSLLAAVIVSPTTFADHGVGNGGDALVCTDGVYMLDSKELEKEGYPIRLPEGSLRTKVETLFDRIAAKDNETAQGIRNIGELLLKDAELFAESQNSQQANTEFGDGELPNVGDEGATFIPPGCKLEQLIIYTPSPTPRQKKFSVRRDLWIQMSLDEQSSAILHEASYAYLLGRVSSPRSASARGFNGFVLADRFSGFTDQQFFDQLKSYGFVIYGDPSKFFWFRNRHGFNYPVNFSKVVYSKDGWIERIDSIENALGGTGGIKLDQPIQLFHGVDFRLNHATVVDLNHGQLKKLFSAGGASFDLDTGKSWGFRREAVKRTSNGALIIPITVNEFRMQRNHKNVINLYGIILKKTPEGVTLSTYRSSVSCSPVALAFNFTEPDVYFTSGPCRERLTPVTFYLDHDLRILREVRGHVKFD